MYLLDTNVVSELRKITAGRAHPNVAAWAEREHVRSLFLSVISILEIETGILRLKRRDPVQAEQLSGWLDRSLLPAFDGRVLGIDIGIARQAAKFHVPDPSSPHDALIAATAVVRSLTLVTRNTIDFRGRGLRLVNPWGD